MAYEEFEKTVIEELADKALELAKILRKAAELAARLPGGIYRCELGTARDRIPVLHRQAKRMELDINEKLAEYAKSAASEAHAREKAKKRGG